MEFNLVRPDHSQPFRYLLELDEEFLLHVMQGLNYSYEQLDRTLSMHSECDKLATNGCKHDVLNCYDVLAETHSAMLSIAGFMREARFVREHREAKSLDSFRELEDKARQVVAAAERTMLPTAQYHVLGPMGTCPDEAEYQDLTTRTQKVDLKHLGTSDRDLNPSVEPWGDRSQIQDPESAHNTDKLPQGGM